MYHLLMPPVGLVATFPLFTFTSARSPRQRNSERSFMASQISSVNAAWKLSLYHRRIQSETLRIFFICSKLWRPDGTVLGFQWTKRHRDFLFSHHTSFFPQTNGGWRNGNDAPYGQCACQRKWAWKKWSSCRGSEARMTRRSGKS